MLFGPPNIKKLQARKDSKQLVRALKYMHDPMIRSGAAIALGALGDDNSVILAALQRTGDSDPERMVRKAAKSALLRLRPANDQVDVAIVGGGIAGCYSAWRITSQGRKVTLFEAQDRLGGRILSLALAGVPCAAELGPMRFSTAQQRINRLINIELGLETYPHFDPDAYETRFFLRGKVIPSANWEDVYPGLKTELKTLCQKKRYVENKAALPDALVAYGIASCLQDVRIDDEYRGENPSETQQLELALQSINPQDPDWKTITQTKLGETAWDIIKQHGIIHLRVGEGLVQQIKLHETGFWNLLQHYLGNEGFLLVHDAGGYESVFGNWNAAEAIKWDVDDFQDQKLLMPARGFQEVVDELRDRILQEGSDIRLSHRLKSVTYWSGTMLPWELEFEKTEKEDEGRIFVRAKAVVLALPQRALQLIDVKDPEGKLHLTSKSDDHESREQKHKVSGKHGLWKLFKTYLLSSVRRQRLFKIFLLYEYPWWSEPEISGVNPVIGHDTGRVNTDLPIRQVYYFGPTWMQDHMPRDNKRPSHVTPDHLPKWGMIMASYSDAHYVDFWWPFARTFQLLAKTDDRFRGNLAAWEKLEDSEREKLENLVNGRHGAPSRMVYKVTRQLAELHGIKPENSPSPLMAVYADWGEEPGLEAGWHTWEINQEPWAISNNIVRPFRDASLFICGEAFSHHQGWIEGALETADQVLSEGFSPSPKS